MENGIQSTTSAGVTGYAPSKAASQTLDKTAFLQLLVAQLKNQDPNQAQDTNQMVQQMTSFAQLEQMQNSNDLLKGLQLQNVGLFQAQASNLVGKQVRIGSSDFQLKDGKGQIGIDLPSAATVRITIKDSSGQVVRTLEQGELKAGSHTVTWDGRDANGVALKDGGYSVEVLALDADGAPVAASTSAFVRVDSVVFVDGSVYVIAGGRRFSLSEVSEIAA